MLPLPVLNKNDITPVFFYNTASGLKAYIGGKEKDGEKTLEKVYASWWSDKPLSVVVPSPQIGAKIAKNTAHRLLLALPAARLHICLETVLNRKYGMQNPINFYAARYPQTLSPEKMMSHLLDEGLTGAWEDEKTRERVKELMFTEKFLTRSTDPYKQFSLATTLSDTFIALESSDPFLRENYRKDGTVVSGIIVANNGPLIVECEKPLRVRSGKLILSLPLDANYLSPKCQQFRLISSRINEKRKYLLTLSPTKICRNKVGEQITLFVEPFLYTPPLRKSCWSGDLPLPEIKRNLPKILATEL